MYKICLIIFNIIQEECQMKKFVVMSKDKYDAELETAKNSAVEKCNNAHTYNSKKTALKSKATTTGLGAALLGSLVLNFCQGRKITKLKTENAVLREVINAWGKKEEE